MKLNLNQKLSEIQAKLKAKKSRYNGFGKYNYRAAEDILEAIKPFLIEYKVALTINEEMINDDNPIIKTTAELLDVESDSAIHATAIVGVDLMSKGMSMPQKFGAASSYGKKYALGNLLLIDDTADADASNDHGVNKESVKPLLSGDALVKAKIAIKSGKFTLDDIKKKYNVTPEIIKTLK